MPSLPQMQFVQILLKSVPISAADGKTVLDTALNIDTVVPGSSIEYPVQADPPTKSGAYQVSASLSYGGNEPVVLKNAPRSREQVVEDVLEAVADEIHLLLEEGVVTEAADVDTGLLLGAGWPFFLGGITKHLDQIGMSERLFGHTFADLTAVAPA